MADLKYYDVILKPVVTEKSMTAMGEIRKSWNSCIVRCSSVPEFITGFSKLPEP